MRSIVMSALLVAVTSPALAQTTIPASTILKQARATFVPITRTVDLSGPRIGFTYLPPETLRRLEDVHELSLRSPISQFGWQFERQFYTQDGGVTAVSEWVVLLGGLDQGVPIPSLSWLVGFRTKEGAEFGVGPNLTPAGAGLVVAAGVTFRAGPFNVPLNFAFVPSRYGTRISVLTGFNTRRH